MAHRHPRPLVTHATRTCRHGIFGTKVWAGSVLLVTLHGCDGYRFIRHFLKGSKRLASHGHEVLGVVIDLRRFVQLMPDTWPSRCLRDLKIPDSLTRCTLPLSEGTGIAWRNPLETSSLRESLPALGRGMGRGDCNLLLGSGSVLTEAVDVKDHDWRFVRGMLESYQVIDHD